MTEVERKSNELLSAEAEEKALGLLTIKNTDNLSAYQLARQRVLYLQRQLAELKGEEYCLSLPLEYLWDTGASLPHLLQSERRTFLLYFIKINSNSLFSKSAEVVQVAKTKKPIAILEFNHCYAVKAGIPGDNYLDKHLLYGNGLTYNAAFTVENSKWVSDTKDLYYAGGGEKPNHYLFTFHDSIVECLACGYTITVVDKTMLEAITETCQRFA